MPPPDKGTTLGGNQCVSVSHLAALQHYVGESAGLPSEWAPAKYMAASSPLTTFWIAATPETGTKMLMTVKNTMDDAVGFVMIQ